MIGKLLFRRFQILGENRKKLMDAGFTPGDPIPQEEELGSGKISFNYDFVSFL